MWFYATWTPIGTKKIFEIKFYRLMIIAKPFGAFDFMEEKVKLAWYVEKDEGFWWGASSTQERK